eukprot:153117-Hanusia_phi.AAC.4
MQAAPATIDRNKIHRRLNYAEVEAKGEECKETWVELGWLSVQISERILRICAERGICCYSPTRLQVIRME